MIRTSFKVLEKISTSFGEIREFLEKFKNILAVTNYSFKLLNDFHVNTNEFHKEARTLRINP